MPLNLEEIIPADDSVRLLSQILDELDYRELVRAYSPLGRKAAIEPKNLFKVIVYGYHCGIYSSRKIHQSCRRDINFRWLLEGKSAPSKSTIAAFRTGRLEKAVEGLFYQMAERLYARGEIGFENLFVDGTKIEANANRYSFVWKKSVTKQQKKRSEKEQELLAALAQRYGYAFSDVEHATEYLSQQAQAQGLIFVTGKGNHKTQLQRDIEVVRDSLEKKQRYAQYQETFGSKRSSFSKTDKDATFMRMKEDHMRNGQLKPGYNIQLGVEGEYIVGLDICSACNDSTALIPLLKRMEAGHGRKHRAIVADAGYESEENYTYLEHTKQECYIKPANYEQSKKRSIRNDPFRKENMPYDSETDSYRCPNGRRILAVGEKTRASTNGYLITKMQYRCEDCRDCPLRQTCFHSKDPNKNREWEISKAFLRQSAQSRARIVSPKGILLRMNRSIQSEGVFAVIKEDYAFRRFLTRGSENVRTEMLLMAMGYNIFRLHCKIQSNRTRKLLFERQIA